MPSKKRKYNARFPAGRIKKIMQTDEEVGKVAQAVPIIISRTLELFVESLLKKAMQVTVARNAKTLSPSHVKQCIQAESRFDFLRDLVKNIPDVSAAEEKDMSADSSPNSSRFSDMSVPRRIARQDSNSSSSSDVKVPIPVPHNRDTELPKPRIETVTSTIVSTDAAIDLSKKKDEPRMANFYQETLPEVQHRSVIQVNPTYATPQPSTSNYVSLTSVEPLQRIEVPKQKPLFFVDLKQNSLTNMSPPVARLNTPPRTPVTPILNIDFSKNLANPEIKVLDTSANIVVKRTQKFLKQNSKPKMEVKKEVKPLQSQPADIDNMNSGNLQIDEDYDT